MMLFITCLSWVLLSLFFVVIAIITSSIFYFVLIIKLFLSQPTSFTFFLPLSSPLGVGWGQCMVLSRWLGLNRNMAKDDDKSSIKAGAWRSLDKGKPEELGWVLPTPALCLTHCLTSRKSFTFPHPSFSISKLESKIRFLSWGVVRVNHHSPRSNDLK